MYPTIFTLGTANLGKHTRRGAGILVMGVSGGAVFPPIQGAIADSFNTRISYLVPTCGFVVVLAYVAYHWVTHGMHLLRVKGEAVIATSLEGGGVGGGESRTPLLTPNMRACHTDNSQVLSAPTTTSASSPSQLWTRSDADPLALSLSRASREALIVVRAAWLVSPFRGKAACRGSRSMRS